MRGGPSRPGSSSSSSSSRWGRHGGCAVYVAQGRGAAGRAVTPAFTYALGGYAHSGVQPPSMS